MAASTVSFAGEEPLAARVRRALREEGFAAVVRRGTRRLVSPVIATGSLRFYSRALTEVPRAGVDGATFREAHAGEDEALLEGSDRERSAAALVERFRRGDRCFVVESPTGEILHTRWLASSAPYLPERWAWSCSRATCRHDGRRAWIRCGR